MLAFNPVFAPLPGGSGLFSMAVALAFEILLILVLLRKEPIRQAQLALFLILLNVVTWSLLTVSYAIFAPPGLGAVLFILVAELGVVVIESLAVVSFSVREARSTARVPASKRGIFRAVVLANVVSFVVGLIVTPPYPSPATARLLAAEANTQALGLACVRFWLHERRVPESCAELIPRYLDGDDVPFDPWGQPYEVTSEAIGLKGVSDATNRTVFVISSGPDREYGTEDDIIGRFELK